MRRAILGALALTVLACDGDPAGTADAGVALGPQAVLDPALCKDCHPTHYQQWSGSMHAYASEDPVFRAVEAKGQRETDGALGDFCVQCHAPVAHRLGLAAQGSDLDGLPGHLKGVTCAWCHQVQAVHGDRNNPIQWVNDGIMRGGITDPSPRSPHRSAYSPYLDRDTPTDSSALCGSCHDIGLPHNAVHLERTYAEWQGSLFADTDRLRFNSCGHCHTKGSDGQAAVGGPPRRVHDHAMVGVDVALTDWPEEADQRRRIQRELDTTLVVEICVVERRGGAEVEYYLENIGAGHNFPSGAALDRRVWVALQAVAEGQVVHTSGVVGDGEPVVDLPDEDLWLLRDRAYTAEGELTHSLWTIDRVEHDTLPVVVALNPLEPGYVNPHILHRYVVRSDAPLERIETRVHLRPMGLDVLDELIDSGDLDPAFRERMPTFTFAPLVWTPEAAERRLSPLGREALCVPRQ